MNYTTLLNQVTAENTVIDSAVTLMTSLKTMLDAAIVANKAGDPTQLQAISDLLQSKSDALAAAVVANTPATPAVPAP